MFGPGPIFRAAHSIKGGGASFGFMEMSSFTHVMETLLDEMRDGRRMVSRDCVDLLLESVDVLRDMVNNSKEHKEYDQQRIEKTHQGLELMLAGNDENEAATEESNAAVAESPKASNDPLSGSGSWLIKFTPNPEMMQSGNEPIRLFQELQSLGQLKVEVDTSELPSFDDIDPKLSYLTWAMELIGDVSEEKIRDLFEWVASESSVEIIPMITPELELAEEVPAQKLEVPATNQGLVEEAAAPTVVEKKVNEKGKTSSTTKDSGGSIRVAINKVDELINMVGELVITQSMLSQIGSQITEGDQKAQEKLIDGIGQLERNTRELQESVLQIRMLPISNSFSRFPRLVRDLSGKMGKKIGLKLTGENTEVDKTVLEKIGDPMVHLVRNSLDHGIETPEIRLAAGKPETGTLELKAFHDGGDIIIQVIDDGAGLNRDKILSKAIEKGLVGVNEELSDDQICNLIFAPGFSTADQVSDVSGRGVGMDVVGRNVRDLGGNVSISSNEGAGSTVTIRLPLTMAILDGQLVRVSGETYIVSLVSIVESLQMKAENITTVAGEAELYHLRNEYIPIIRVGALLGHESNRAELENGLLMVVEANGKRCGLFVDKLEGQQQVVIKSLETNFCQIQGMSGATILGDGTVSLIIDVPGLIQRHFDECNRRSRPLSAVA
ncbi:MAG: chemotaxis protein CheA [SAR86 cluster bacterium]|uniref:Chemotaxis protein CheA n=1 Tax=SAR86 cluster bacterium TaxID=2030880 RepID=A0A2A5AXL5_9GAMM|nr:MAG: chemotaxis protein CheA [SAR86 cluster bacterium]